MCGNCLLQETAFICPMECPKGLAQWPVRAASTPEYCYVDKTRPCVWYKIYERPSTWAARKCSWKLCPHWTGKKWAVRHGGMWSIRSGRLEPETVLNGLASSEKRNATWQNIFRPVRQPDWWQGMTYITPQNQVNPSRSWNAPCGPESLWWPVKVAPPLSFSTNKLASNIELVKPFVTAINFTDNAPPPTYDHPGACSKIAIGTRCRTRHADRRRDRTARQPAKLRYWAQPRWGCAIYCVSPATARCWPPLPRGPHGWQRPGFDPDALDPAQDARRRSLPGWA